MTTEGEKPKRSAKPRGGPKRAKGKKRPPHSPKLYYAPRPTRGQPTRYSKALAERICERIAGGEYLIEICEDADMPGETTVRGWDLAGRSSTDEERARLPYGEFSAMYARAREIQLEHMNERALVRSRKPGKTYVTVTRTEKVGRTTKTIKELREVDDHQGAKLEIDAIHWAQERLAWRRYGKRVPKVEAENVAQVEENPGLEVRVIIEGGLPD